MNNDYTCLMAASFSLEGHEARALTREEIEVLQNDKECVSDFKRNKLEIEARKNWDLFYKRNTTNFFKDRRWLTREFPELMQAITEASNLGTCTMYVMFSHGSLYTDSCRLLGCKGLFFWRQAVV